MGSGSFGSSTPLRMRAWAWRRFGSRRPRYATGLLRCPGCSCCRSGSRNSLPCERTHITSGSRHAARLPPLAPAAQWPAASVREGKKISERPRCSAAWRSACPPRPVTHFLTLSRAFGPERRARASLPRRCRFAAQRPAAFARAAAAGPAPRLPAPWPPGLPARCPGPACRGPRRPLLRRSPSSRSAGRAPAPAAPSARPRSRSGRPACCLQPRHGLPGLPPAAPAAHSAPTQLPSVAQIGWRPAASARRSRRFRGRLPRPPQPARRPPPPRPGPARSSGRDSNAPVLPRPARPRLLSPRPTPAPTRPAQGPRPAKNNASPPPPCRRHPRK